MAYFKCKGTFKSYINITNVANATVTATANGNSYSAVCDSNGYASIKVKKKGTYTITSTGTSRVAHAAITSQTPVTAYYIWNKYNAQYVYTTNWTWNTYFNSYTSGDSTKRGYTPMQFNKVNGTFWNGGTEVMIYFGSSGSFDLYNISSFFWVQSGTANYCWNLRSMYYGGQTGSGKDFYKMDGYKITLGSQTWEKTTYIEQVTSTSLSTYPTDGYSSGYWYVAA